MAFPFPPDNTQPIPNSPFYYPEGAYLYGPSGPLIVGSGFSINSATGTINVSGGGSGAPTILAGAGISVTSGVGTVTIANTGIRTVTAGAGIGVTVSGGNLNIVNTLPAPSSFGTVTQINTGAGLIGGPITTSGTIGLTMTGVSPGTYNNATITVDSYGRITFASPGSSFSGGITASGPIAVTSTFPQNVSIQAASTSASGAVQLNDTVTSTSTSQAATANAVKVTYDVASQAQTDATNAGAAAAAAIAQSSSAQALASTANTNAATALATATTAQNDATNALAAAASAQSDATTALATANAAQTTANSAVTIANNRIPCAAFTGLGQLLVGTGASTFTALNAGVNGRILAANSLCASGLEWVPQTVGTVTSILTGVGLAGGPISGSGTIYMTNTGVTPGTYTNSVITVDAQGRLTSAASGPPDIVNSIITAKGDLITGTASGNPVSLGIGPDGHVLTACSTCFYGMTWAPASGGGAAAIPCSVITGKGDIVIGSAPSTPTALPPGADGQVLLACAACAEGLTWGAPGGVGTVTSVGTGTGLTGGPITSAGTIALANTAVTPGSYTLANITVDAQGRITAASSGTAGNVTQVNTGTGLTGGPITSTGTVALADTAVTPGSYTYGSFTVDQQGRLTAASSGATPVASVAVTAPITDTGTATAPNIGIQTATTGQLGAVQVGTNIDVAAGVISVKSSTTAQSGIVQLNDTVTSTSTTEALTAAQGKSLQDQINALAVTTNLTLAGTFDASTSQMLSVTASGTSAGFTVGSDLPAPSAGLIDYFVIVTTAGSYSPPGGGGPYAANQGDWFLCDGASWQFLNVGTDLPIASTGTAGIVELADTAETQAGTDTTRAVTPAGAAATYVPLADFTAKGDLLSATGANTPVAIPVGVDGEVLTACAAAPTGLCWASAAVPAIPCACITGKGALVTGTAANTPVALPVGADNTALIACAACPEGLTWAAVVPTDATPTVAGVVKGLTDANNSALGCEALNSVTTGVGNTALGCKSATSLTSGNSNTFVGEFSGCSLTSGCFNVLVGGGSGLAITTACCNVLMGGASGVAITVGNANVAIGDGAGSSITTGCFNVALGPQVQVADGTQSCQLALGFANGSNWLTGDSGKNIQPGAGLRDCAGNLGNPGQYLCSTGTALEWSTGMGDTPVGAVNWFASMVAPSGWLVADGRDVSRTGYAALFAAIGTTYGAGDGSTTFTLPDLRGMFLRGWDNAGGGVPRGCDPARVFGTTQQDEFESHNHAICQWRATFTTNTGGFYGNAPVGGNIVCSTLITATGGSETRPMNVALLPCIKYEVTTAPQNPTGGIPCACITGKGAIITGTAANTPVALPVGTDGLGLVACSACAAGVAWAPSYAGVPSWDNNGPIVFGATTTPPSPANVGGSTMQYRQLGPKEWEVVMSFNKTGGGTAGSGDYLFTLPAGLSFDTSLLWQTPITGLVGVSTAVWWQYMLPGPSQSFITDYNTVTNFAAPVVYDATRFRIVGRAPQSATRPWGSGWFTISAGNAAQIRFQFTSQF